MAFKVIVERTKQDFLQFHRLHKKLHYKVFYLIVNIVVVLLIAVLLAGAVFLSVYGLWSATLIRHYVFLSILFPLWALVGRFNAWTAFRNQLQAGPLTMEFADVEVRVFADRMKEQYAYSAFRELVHWRETYYLYVDKKHCILLPERCFKEGDPAAFSGFIAAKTGLEIKELK